MQPSVDLSDDNFKEEPWEYPGTPPPYSGLLHQGGYPRLTPQRGRRLGQSWVQSGSEESQSLNHALLTANVARVDQRQLVVAVGSNASPAVMRRKFLTHDVNTTIPFIRARVHGMRIGHSAHVSIPGYIAATPLLSKDAITEVFVSLLDQEQLECLDDTEPNYVRRLVYAEKCRLDLEGRTKRLGRDPDVFKGGEQPGHFLLYVSTWGLLGPPGGEALERQPQEELFARLYEHCPGFAALLPDDARGAMRALAADEELREQAAQLFKDEDWVVDSGFAEDPSRPAVAPYGSIPCTWQGDQAPDGALVCVPSADDLDRQGEQCVVVHPTVAQRLGRPPRVGVTALQGPELAAATARLVVDESMSPSSAGVDQVLRNALGLEVQERVSLKPAFVRTRPVADMVLAKVHFSMVRVQAADLASVEQSIGLLTPTALDVLGVQSGDEVVLQGAPGTDGKVRDVRMSVYAAPEETIQRRERLSGGAMTARFPSASDALGVYPDLPWLFLDSASRTRLGLQGHKLSVVRMRASRRFQLTREFRELVLLLVLAFVGLTAVISSATLLLTLLGVVVIASFFIVRSRLKHRLENQ